MPPFKISRHSQSLNMTSDEELFIQMRNSSDPILSRKAWNEFYYRYSKYLWNCCIKSCSSLPEGEALAKDIFQATVLKIYNNAQNFDPKKSTGIKAWIGRIAQNEFNDYYNKYNAKFSSLESCFLNAEEIEDTTTDEQDISEEEINILDNLEAKQLTNLLSCLNPKEIKVLMTYMSYYQIDNPNTHLPNEETKKLCLEFNIKSDALRQIKKRALDKLKRAFHDFAN